MSKVDTEKAPASGPLHSPSPSYSTFPQDSDTTYSLTDSKIWLNLTSSESSSLDSILTNSQSSSIPHPALFLFLLLFVFITRFIVLLCVSLHQNTDPVRIRDSSVLLTNLSPSPASKLFLKGHESPGDLIQGRFQLGRLWRNLGLCLLNKPPGSVQFSDSVMSDSLRPHESQHARPPCPSPILRVYSDSCPSSW